MGKRKVEKEKRSLVVRAVRVLGALETQQLKHLTALVARVLLAIVLDAAVRRGGEAIGETRDGQRKTSNKWEKIRRGCTK